MKRSLRKRKSKRLVSWVLSLAILLGFLPGLTACGQEGSGQGQAKPEDPPQAGSEEAVEEDPVKEAVILCFGDIMHHKQQDDYAVAVGGGEPDFHPEMHYVKSLAQSADLTIGNWETTCNKDLPSTGYPTFNTPPEALTAVKDAGFDVLTTANNHCLDRGLQGIENTIDNIHANEMDVVGTTKPDWDPDLIKDLGGIKLGILAYSEIFNGLEASLTEEERGQYLKEMDMDQVAEDIARLKDKGADFILVYPHTGIEYASENSDHQAELYHKMADLGADAVIGNHSHVVQPYESYESDHGPVPIVYACGNVVSGQRESSLGIRETEESVAVEMKIEKDKEGTRLVDIHFHPLWVRLTRRDAGLCYQVVPTESVLDPDHYQTIDGDPLEIEDFDIPLSDDELNRIRLANDHVLDQMGQGQEEGGDQAAWAGDGLLPSLALAS